jgi:hypothetical protein
MKMARAHVKALQKKRETLEKKIHQELVHAARDEQAIKRLKRQRLHVEEELSRLDAR